MVDVSRWCQFEIYSQTIAFTDLIFRRSYVPNGAAELGESQAERSFQRRKRGYAICRRHRMLSRNSNNQWVTAALAIKRPTFKAGLTDFLSESDKIALLHAIRNGSMRVCVDEQGSYSICKCPATQHGLRFLTRRGNRHARPCTCGLKSRVRFV